MIQFPTRFKLPKHLKIIRREMAFLQDLETGVTIPAILCGPDGHETPSDQEVKQDLELLGYQELPDQDGFELANKPSGQLPLPSCN